MTPSPPQGVEYPWEAYRATGLGISRENVMKKVLGQLEEEKLLELMKRKEDHVRTILDAEKVERVPGALEFVKEARRHGLKTAVATSSRNPELFLGAGGYRDTFDLIVGRRDVQLPKPHPETYLPLHGSWGSPPPAASPSKTHPRGSRRPLPPACRSSPWSRRIPGRSWRSDGRP